MKPSLVITDITTREEMIVAIDYMKKEFPGIYVYDPDDIDFKEFSPFFIRTFQNQSTIWLIKMKDMIDDLEWNYHKENVEYETISIRSLIHQESFIERHNRNLRDIT